jgi:hypothetical protein
LSVNAAEEVAGLGSSDPVAACSAAHKKLAEPLSGSRKNRRNFVSGPIEDLRVEGTRRNALYQWNYGKNYSMQM